MTETARAVREKAQPRPGNGDRHGGDRETWKDFCLPEWLTAGKSVPNRCQPSVYRSDKR